MLLKRSLIFLFLIVADFGRRQLMRWERTYAMRARRRWWTSRWVIVIVAGAALAAFVMWRGQTSVTTGARRGNTTPFEPGMMLVRPATLPATSSFSPATTRTGRR